MLSKRAWDLEVAQSQKEEFTRDRWESKFNVSKKYVGGALLNKVLMTNVRSEGVLEIVSKFWQLGRQVISVWVEGFERRYFTRFVYEDEEKLGPGGRLCVEGILMCVGRVKVPKMDEEVLKESEEGQTDSFDDGVGNTGDVGGLVRREIGDNTVKELQVKGGGECIFIFPSLTTTPYLPFFYTFPSLTTTTIF